ncbi:hypothetical protein O181_018079 [Austropuccinia psidii MF-1]|uniref:RNase H type-1 domain-containing protein n=1 Tax=Austropuccinia psidii MF-1 TaxID=1389203 RepID=A0A9Q3C4L3_9BASI|nr:hypothetical protein [Austropuccinia psidii MF-1]
MIFTDGSDIPNKGKGEEAVIEKDNIILSKHLPISAKASNFETELVGIILAIEAARRAIAKERIKGQKTNRIYIFSDNQGELMKSKHPRKPSTAQNLYLEIYHNINSLKKIAPVQLWWCPGHIGITGNELEDEEAKDAARETNNNQITEEEIQHTKQFRSKLKSLKQTKAMH